MLSWIECKDSEKFRISKENTDKICTDVAQGYYTVAVDTL